MPFQGITDRGALSEFGFGFLSRRRLVAAKTGADPGQAAASGAGEAVGKHGIPPPSPKPRSPGDRSPQPAAVGTDAAQAINAAAENIAGTTHAEVRTAGVVWSDIVGLNGARCQSEML